MINIFTKLKNEQLSQSEKIIANYIIEHPEEVLKMNVQQIKDQCFVSTATLYRLCDKLGLSGFSDLKVKISHSLNSNMKQAEEFNYDYPIKQYQTHYSIIETLKQDYENTLTSTSQLFQLDELNKIVHQLKKAKHIDIYTSSANIYFAENFKFQMQEIGVQVNVPIEEYQQRLSASQSDSSHIAIIISFGGRGLIINRIASILNARQVPIILISAYDAHIKDIHETYHLYISPHENHYNKISSYSTRLSILYILDVLYTCYFELDYSKNIEKKLEYYDYMNK